jgi:hypothetical protein
MKHIFIQPSLIIVASASFLVGSTEAQNAVKLEEELFMIDLAAAVGDGRRAVNKVMAAHLGVRREQLVAERKETTLPYGELFAAHKFAGLGNAPFTHVAQDMKEGQSLLEVSTEHQVKLKKVLSSARKLNKAIDKELDRMAKGEESDRVQDIADAYDPSVDYLSADTAGFTPEQFTLANERIYRRSSSGGLTNTGATNGPRGVSRSDQHQSGRVGSTMGGARRRGGRGPGL